MHVLGSEPHRRDLKQGISRPSGAFFCAPTGGELRSTALGSFWAEKEIEDQRTLREVF